MLGTLPIEADWMLAAPPAPPFDWVREGTSYWLFEENGAFGIPRNGVEAEPWSWDNRRFQSNFAFADGRILQRSGVGAMPPILDSQGRPAIFGGGPLTYQCIEPFARWLVKFDGMVIDTHVSNQIALTVDPEKLIPLKYEFELTMVVPPNEQDISPGKFASWGKGKQRDAASVGLGWRFEQMLRGEGEIEVDGTRKAAKVNGSRIKRRSLASGGGRQRTEHLFHNQGGYGRYNRRTCRCQQTAYEGQASHSIGSTGCTHEMLTFACKGITSRGVCGRSWF